MSYVHVTNGVIDSGELRRPTKLFRVSDGARVLWWDGITEAELNACGWFAVVQVARPADTPTHTSDRSVTLVNGSPTETWTLRLKTQAELDADTARTNDATIRQQAETALSNNRTYLQIASPTNAQNAAQLRALTQQMNGVIRLILGKLDGTN
jgi:hypothetical protein